MKAAPTTRDVTCSTALCKSRIPGMDWCLNPYTGCEHACAYCYATFMKRFTGHQGSWGSFVDVKSNVTEVLSRQLRRRKRGRVMLASVTDAWQPLEREKGLTRACLELLVDSGLSLWALTKSDLVVRDIDLFRAFRGLLGDVEVSVGITLTTLSDEVAALIEPGASSPSRRLDALEQLSAAGIRTAVFMAPILPGLTDSPRDILALVDEVRRRGAQEVQADPLNFYPGALRGVGKIIELHRPKALPIWRAAVARPDAWRKHLREALGEMV